VIPCVFGRAPDAGDAELAATAFGVVIWAVHLSLSVTLAAALHAPAERFRVGQCVFYFLL
jgi:hypothetical protein